MKLKITTLKAPWPAGARVGDVVELAARTLPGWALGKCVQVDDDAEVTVAFPEKDEGDAEHPEVERLRAEMVRVTEASAGAIEQARNAHAAEVRTLKAEHAAALAGLQAKLDAAVAGDAGKHQSLLDANAALTKQLAEAQAALAAKASPGRRG